MFKIATLNSWKCDGDYRQRLSLMAEQIANDPPDILALQEVFATEDINTATFLSRRLGLGRYYEKARYKMRMFDEGLQDTYSGLALLSGFPVSEDHRIDLPTHADDGERIAQMAHIQTPLGNAWVINLHLTYLENETEVRLRQVEKILSILPDEPDDPDEPVFLTGDFNLEDTSPVYDWLIGLRHWHVSDAARDADDRFNTLHDEPKRIDYIFMLQRTSRWRFQNARPFAASRDAETGITPSDHLGIIVEVAEI